MLKINFVFYDRQRYARMPYLRICMSLGKYFLNARTPNRKYLPRNLNQVIILRYHFPVCGRGGVCPARYFLSLPPADLYFAPYFFFSIENIGPTFQL